MLRILAEAMRIGIRKDVCAVMRGDNAVLPAGVSRQTRVPVRVQIPCHDAIAYSVAGFPSNRSCYRIARAQEDTDVLWLPGPRCVAQGGRGFAENSLIFASISSRESAPPATIASSIRASHRS